METNDVSEHTAPVALVTGAKQGIGRAIAMSLGKRGFRVVINDLEVDESFTETLDALRSSGMEAHGAPGDVADPEGCEGLLDTAFGCFGRLDCLVNNAGVSVLKRGDLLDVSMDSFDRCVAVNLRGTFFLTQSFARRLVQSRATQIGVRPSIINITSANAEMVSITRAEYCISKAGESMLTRLFATRLADMEVGVYEVCPGLIKTEMTAASGHRYQHLVDTGGVPSRRWGSPEDVGEVAATLACEGLPYTVGQPIYVDGGLRLPRF